MRILVLGGTAWVGREVVGEALRRGHEVTALARGEAGAPPTGARFVRADRDAPDAYAAVTGDDWDAVIDLATHPGHVRSAASALAGRARHAVYVSTCSVYLRANEGGTGELGDDESAPVHAPLAADAMASLEEYGAAKVACEDAVRAAFGEAHSFIARPSLIGGPGDPTQRTTYWPARFAHPSNPERQVLVPDTPERPTQVTDVRDLAAFLVDAAERRFTGIANVTGETLPFSEHLSIAQRAVGWSGTLVAADEAWLVDRQVGYWAGPRSLPLWLPTELVALAAHDSSRAVGLGLRRRPLEESLRDGADQAAADAPAGPAAGERRAGLTDDAERALLAELAAEA
jgi:nucleoside-diphosphate-sugar epimerase